MGLSLKQVSMEEEFDWSKTELPKLTKSKQQIQNQIQPNVDQLKCPRCDSANTKFCYFNNYNKSQPRHFCRACKRHWTNGGTLRNVPVGGCRKNKRLKKTTPKSSKSSSASAAFAAVSAAASTSDGLQNLPLFQSLFPISSEFENFTVNYGVLNSENMDFSTISSTTSTQSLISQKLCNQLDDELLHVETEKTEQPGVYHTWQYPETGGGGADMSESYWSWDDIETFAGTDLNITWDDDNDIKP